jgi:hypothetical protein
MAGAHPSMDIRQRVAPLFETFQGNIQRSDTPITAATVETPQSPATVTISSALEVAHAPFPCYRKPVQVRCDRSAITLIAPADAKDSIPMPLVSRRPIQALVVGAVLTLGAFSLSSASALSRQAEVNNPAPSAEVAAAAAGLTASYHVRDTVSRIAKLRSEMATGEGRYDGAVDAVKKTLSGTITLPPTKDAYFVTFGFMPTTSTVELTADGDQGGQLLKNPGDAGEVASRPFPDGKKYMSVIADLTLRLSIRVSDTKVDGKVLDVGTGCKTESPVIVKTKGLIGLDKAAPPTAMKSDFEIPPFTGCGVRENLDKLITGLISGPGNEMRTSIAVRCIGTCPPG